MSGPEETREKEPGGEIEQIERIDVDATLRTRAPRVWSRLPRRLIRWLEELIHQDDLNRILENNRGLRGVDFCRRVLEELQVSYRIKHEERLPSREDRRVVYVSNHPLGALDGICLIDFLGHYHGKEGLRFVVNDLLTAIAPLRDVFLPINKHGRQSRAASRGIDEAFAGDGPMIVFPAGLVSRKGASGKIRDLKWQKMFVTKALENGRDVIPLHFDARNSAFFYNFARLRRLSGLRFNIEMVLLPREIFGRRGEEFTITVGERVSRGALGLERPGRVAEDLRRLVYSLPGR